MYISCMHICVIYEYIQQYMYHKLKLMYMYMYMYRCTMYNVRIVMVGADFEKLLSCDPN